MEPVAVVAIDFGTARSGYAFTFNDPRDIKLNVFEYQGDTEHEKTVTALAMTGEPRNMEFMAFGHEANFKLYVPEVLRDTQVHGFRYFKMNLFEQQSMLQSITISKACVPIVDLLATSIGFISDRALDHIQEITTDRRRVLREHIQWVLTVPTIWNNAAKQVMRNAAQQAGLPESLILALEPEAAALCCRFNRRNLNTLGTKYMLLDCGGGTVDIVFHEIDSKGDTLELRPPVGGPWGSRKIDKRFEQMMEEIYGRRQLEDNMSVYSDALRSFESAKNTFTPNQVHAVRILMPSQLFKPTHLDECNESNNYTPGITYESEHLVIPKQVMATFFEDPISKIITCVGECISSLDGPLDYIFLVGGFSRNNILRQRIKSSFEIDNTKVVIPEKSHMAVVEGAVHFGLNPSIISSRLSAYSYGIRGVRPFQRDDLEQLKVMIDGEPYCSSIFHCFVKVNQRVQQDQKVEQLFAPAYKGQTSATIPIFATKDRALKYITGDMQEMGRLVIDIPKSTDPKQRNIKVTMLFGGTEIKVRAEHTLTQQSLSCAIDFSFASGLPDISQLRI